MLLKILIFIAGSPRPLSGVLSMTRLRSFQTKSQRDEPSGKTPDGAGAAAWRVMPHILFMPVGLTEAEKIEWEEEHTSPAALAAAGIPSNALIVMVTWFGSKDQTPPA